MIMKKQGGNDMYKMICLDLDGTLLNDCKEISQENINLIRRAYNEKGIICVFATGRPLEYVDEICNSYDSYLSNYIIASNGAIIRDNKNDEVIYKASLTNAQILNLKNIFLEENADYMIVYTDKKQVLREASNTKALKDSAIIVNKKDSEIKHIEDAIKNNPNLSSLLCMIGGDSSILENIISRLNEIGEIETPGIGNYSHKTENYSFESKFIDVMKKGCSKKNAIYFLADKLKIKKEEIIVMGDGSNDLSMFECAGLKIAMENAEEKLKEKADFITASNNDDGVAKAIQKFIFNEI